MSVYDGVCTCVKLKRAQLVLNHAWVHHVSSHEVVFRAVQPVWSDAPGLRASPPTFYSLVRPVLRTGAQEADTVVWLARARKPLATSGALWLDRHPRVAHNVPGTRPRDAALDQVMPWNRCVARTTDY